jgi:hypothetical protein
MKPTRSSDKSSLGGPERRSRLTYPLRGSGMVFRSQGNPFKSAVGGSGENGRGADARPHKAPQGICRQTSLYRPAPPLFRCCRPGEPLPETSTTRSFRDAIRFVLHSLLEPISALYLELASRHGFIDTTEYSRSLSSRSSTRSFILSFSMRNCAFSPTGNNAGCFSSRGRIL